MVDRNRQRGKVEGRCRPALGEKQVEDGSKCRHAAWSEEALLAVGLRNARNMGMTRLINLADLPLLNFKCMLQPRDHWRPLAKSQQCCVCEKDEVRSDQARATGRCVTVVRKVTKDKRFSGR